MRSISDDAQQCRPYNAVSDFIDINVARGFGNKFAFIDGERSLTYAQLQSRTFQLAGAFKSLGLRQENRIALLLNDTVDFPTAFWGAVRAGIIVVPINTLSTSEQCAYILENSRASAIVIAAKIAETMSPILERARHLQAIILAEVGGEERRPFPSSKVHLLEELIAGNHPEPFTADTVSDEIAFWLYSSGSAGGPNGVQHVHSSPIAAAKNFGEGVLGINSIDVVFSVPKLPFAYGLGSSMLFPMSVGATTVLLPHRPLAGAIFELMRRHHPTIFFAVPSLYASLLTHNDVGDGLGSRRLRLCISGGEPLPAHLGERWRKIVGLDIIDSIGSTEMLTMFISNRPDDVRYGSSGKPVPGFEAKILNESGNEASHEEIGELIVRGPTAGQGYWNQRAKSRRTFVGEWTYTGDKYFRDKRGYYFYCGRVDDMFKVDGAWVSPHDVEAALLSHEAILEAAVIGKQDTDGLTKPKALIVLNSGYDPGESLFEALKLYVKAWGGVRLCPRWIEVRQTLPRTVTGKSNELNCEKKGESVAAETFSTRVAVSDITSIDHNLLLKIGCVRGS